MKKFFYLFIAGALVLAACGQGEKPGDKMSADKKGAAAVEYKDGIYRVTYNGFDAHGWKPGLEVQIRGGKVVSASYDYTNKEGKRKSEDKGYAEAMKKQAGVDPNDAVTKLIEDLVARNAADIDGVAGASGTSSVFKEAAAAALEKAKVGDSKEQILPMNDTYSAEEKDFDAHGWKGSVAITFKDGKITQVSFEEKNKDGKLKKDDAEYNKMMKEKSGTSFVEAAAKLTQTLVEKQDSKLVDSVSGATEASTRFKTLVTQALSVR